MSNNLFAGFPTQIRKLRNRIKQLEMEEVDPKDIKTAVESLRELESLHKDELDRKEERRKAREEKLNQQKKESDNADYTEDQPSEPQEVGLEYIFKENLKNYEDPRKAMEVSLSLLTGGAFDAIEGQSREDLIDKSLEKVRSQTYKKVEKESDVEKFALDDVVEPVRGTPGSWGLVMRFEPESDLVYVSWQDGKLAETHGFGAYKSSDVKKKSSRKSAAGLTDVIDTITDPILEMGKDPSIKQLEKDLKEGRISQEEFNTKKYELYNPKKKTAYESQSQEGLETEKCQVCKEVMSPEEYQICEECREKMSREKAASSKKIAEYLTEEGDEVRYWVTDDNMLSVSIDVGPENISNPEYVMWYDAIGEHGEGLPGDALPDHKEISYEEAKKHPQWSMIPDSYREVQESRSGDDIRFPGERKEREEREKRFEEKRKHLKPEEREKLPEQKESSNKKSEEGIGYGGNRPGTWVSPKIDEDVSLNADEEESIDADDLLPNEPVQGDIIIVSEGPLGSETVAYQDGKEIARSKGDWDEFEDQIRKHMEETNFYTDVWTQDDHGGIERTPIQATKKQAQEEINLDIANRQWVAKYAPNARGWAIFDDQGQQIMIIKSDEQLNKAQLEQIVWDELGKRDLVRATLSKDLAVLKKGSKVKVMAVDTKRREVKFASEGNKSITGWTSLDKFSFKVKKAYELMDDVREQAPEDSLEGSKVKDGAIRIKSLKLLTDLSRNCPECFDKFVKFAEQKGLKIKADDVEEAVTNVREKIQQTKERLQETIETKAASEHGFQKGDRVTHPDKGEGTVTYVSPEQITVDWDWVGQKILGSEPLPKSKIKNIKKLEADAARTCPKCGEEVWDVAKGHKINKCWNCGLAFDSPENDEVEKEAQTPPGPPPDDDPGPNMEWYWDGSAWVKKQKGDTGAGGTYY